MDLPEGVHVTTAVLLRGTLMFVILDLPLLYLLWRLVKPPAFARLRRILPVVTAVTYAVIWAWAVTYFWDRVYGYVFPPWSRWYLPAAQALLTGALAWFATLAAARLRTPVIAFCLFGGLWGVVSHVWAVFMGIVAKPPFLQGASPAAAVLIAFFEFTFYWGVIALASYAVSRLTHHLSGSGRGTQVGPASTRG